MIYCVLHTTTKLRSTGVCRKCYLTTYRKENKPRLNELARTWYSRNVEKVAKWHKQWRIHNSDKAKIINREWVQNNLGKHNAKCARRRAAKLRATPAWADHEKINKIYADCPPGYHVDHIIPLQGKNVSGLHVEYNLQYLPAKDNLSKGNKLYV